MYRFQGAAFKTDHDAISNTTKWTPGWCVCVSVYKSLDDEKKNGDQHYLNNKV